MDTKYTLSTTEARQNFSEVIEKVEKSGVRVTLTVNGKPKAVLINAEELESLQETVSILGDSDALARIRASQKEFAKSESIPLHELLNDGAGA